MDGKSLNITEDKIQQLRSLFPEVFTENKVDFTRLRDILGDDILTGKEQYELSWAGKTEARREIQKQTTATLIPDRENSVNFDTAENLFIEGENLEVLRVLQKSYYGKVKMIYIDPPYNTGNDSFVYPDDFSERQDEYNKRAGITNEDGYLNKQDLWKKNTKESGQFHSVWLSMMYPRLFLARNLLKEDGVIFVSIDDNEQANLKLLMDEIFGEENFVATIVWQKKYAATNDSKGFSTLHDYIVCYQMSNSFNRNLLPRTNEQNKPYKNDDNDGKGLWRSDNLLVKSYSESAVYAITNPNTGKEYYPPNGSSWRANINTMKKWLEENRIYFGKSGAGAPQLKRYLNEVQQGSVPTTWWTFEDAGHNDAANKELQLIFKSKAPFDTPKPTKLLNLLLKIATDEGDLVMDFFAGSSATAHAIIDLNKDGGNRKYVMVQMPEPVETNSEAAKAGYNTIADISRTRIKKVIEQIDGEQDGKLALEKQQNLGFKAYKLAPSNFKVWRNDITGAEQLKQQLEVFTDSKKEGSNYESMMYELLLKAGLPLTATVQQLQEGMYSIYGGKLLLCFAAYNTTIGETVIKQHPDKAVFLNSSFERDNDLTNFKLQLKEAGIELTII